jgi:hypothetical protein
MVICHASTAIKHRRTHRAYDARTMATITKRPYGFQLRISHKLLPKDLWATFDTREAAEQYGRQLEGLLAQGKNHLSKIKKSDRENFFRFEFFSLGEEISFRERNYLWAIRLMAEQDLKFFKKNYDLAKKLYVNATTRAFVINVLDKYKEFCEDLLKSDKNQN